MADLTFRPKFVVYPASAAMNENYSAKKKAQLMPRPQSIPMEGLFSSRFCCHRFYHITIVFSDGRLECSGCSLHLRFKFFILSAAMARKRFMTDPVPAGIKRPTITFSFSPTRLSRFPETAASVSTRVVSWKDAAETKEDVCSDAFVLPCSIGMAFASYLLLPLPLAFTSPNSSRSSSSLTNSVESPPSVTSTF